MGTGPGLWKWRWKQKGNIKPELKNNLKSFLRSFRSQMLAVRRFKFEVYIEFSIKVSRLQVSI